MLLEPITTNDKLGRTITLRSAKPEDAADLLQYLKVTCRETPFLIREPEEVTITLDSEKSFIEDKLNSEGELLLIATIDGKHIGNCSLMKLASYKRYSHRCEVAIALYKEYCDCGIGTIMLRTVLDVAAKIGYEQAELEVVAENKNAITLYEKLGFKIYGTFPDNMKYSDGKYVDAYWMMKKL